MANVLLFFVHLSTPQIGSSVTEKGKGVPVFNPLNVELNPICHLLALL
jgi:hypothetical protein